MNVLYKRTRYYTYLYPYDSVDITTRAVRILTAFETKRITLYVCLLEGFFNHLKSFGCPLGYNHFYMFDGYYILSTIG